MRKLRRLAAATMAGLAAVAATVFLTICGDLRAGAYAGITQEEFAASASPFLASATGRSRS